MKYNFVVKYIWPNIRIFMEGSCPIIEGDFDPMFELKYIRNSCTSPNCGAPIIVPRNQFKHNLRRKQTLKVLRDKNVRQMRPNRPNI